MPIRAGELAIDAIPLPEHAHRKAVLSRALATADVDETTGRRVPILAATWLAYMKPASPRGKDRDDIVGMMQAGTVDREALANAVAGDTELEARLAEALRELALADE
jgi:hypothetical protein